MTRKQEEYNIILEEVRSTELNLAYILSRDIATIFKLFHEKSKTSHKKQKWSRIKTFWTIQNSLPVISSINKCNKH